MQLSPCLASLRACNYGEGRWVLIDNEDGCCQLWETEGGLRFPLPATHLPQSSMPPPPSKNRVVKPSGRIGKKQASRGSLAIEVKHLTIF